MGLINYFQTIEEEKDWEIKHTLQVRTSLTRTILKGQLEVFCEPRKWVNSEAS